MINNIKSYIFDMLEKEYTFKAQLSDKPNGSLKHYIHNETGKPILLLETKIRNDDVFRKLNNIDSKGYLPQIYAVVSDDDALYILQEYVEGISAVECENHTQSQIIQYAIDVCRALQILHSLGIVHRDVKPGNVVIKPDDHACLIDLSIAKVYDEIKNADTINLGTVGYAAPEQYGFMQSRPETDIYAFGIMLNVMLTGTHPLKAIPKGKVGRIIKKCTALNIEERYPVVNEIIYDLNKIK